jgi:hypothetical protein
MTLAEWIEQRTLPLRHAVAERRHQQLTAWIGELDRWEPA